MCNQIEKLLQFSYFSWKNFKNIQLKPTKNGSTFNSPRVKIKPFEFEWQMELNSNYVYDQLREANGQLMFIDAMWCIVCHWKLQLFQSLLLYAVEYKWNDHWITTFRSFFCSFKFESRLFSLCVGRFQHSLTLFSLIITIKRWERILNIT